MTTIKAEIISIGTELILGQIANTNAQWMSEKLAEVGVNTYYHTALGDNIDRLENTFRLAQDRSDAVIVTGGLGPTEDDLSREAFQQMTGIEIIEEPVSLKKIKDYFHSQKREMTPNNIRQARIFAGSRALENKVGMAPGIHLTYDEVDWFFLPGVPREMKQLFQDDVIPHLQNINGQQIIASKVLKFVGIGESDLEHQLLDLIQAQTNPTIAPLARDEGMTLRLTAKGDSLSGAEDLLDEMKGLILNRVGQHYYGEDDETIAEVIANILKDNNMSLAAAESLTGGAFSSQIVSVPGSSAYFKGSVVSYDTSIKRDVLKIPQSLLDGEGTVSDACAEAMAANVMELMDAEIGISFTGVAGPETVEGKEAGTVVIAIQDQSGYKLTKTYHFRGNRNEVRRRSVQAGYAQLYFYLKNNLKQ